MCIDAKVTGMTTVTQAHTYDPVAFIHYCWRCVRDSHSNHICLFYAFIYFSLCFFCIFFFVVFIILLQVWILWAKICCGKLPRNFPRQPPIRSHVLRSWSPKGPWELHETHAQSGRHPRCANWRPGTRRGSKANKKCCNTKMNFPKCVSHELWCCGGLSVKITHPRFLWSVFFPLQSICVSRWIWTWVQSSVWWLKERTLRERQWQRRQRQHMLEKAEGTR